MEAAMAAMATILFFLVISGIFVGIYRSNYRSSLRRMKDKYDVILTKYDLQSFKRCNRNIIIKRKENDQEEFASGIMKEEIEKYLFFKNALKKRRRWKMVSIWLNSQIECYRNQ